MSQAHNASAVTGHRAAPWLFVGVLLAALAAAVAALRPPAPAPAGAPLDRFSAERALVDVQQIAQRPHPAGSEESIRVRAYLVRRMEALGLEASVRSSAARRPDGAGVMVHNVLGVLPGADRALPAVMLMSHSDSTPRGPGAGDAAAGVAAALESVRALKAAGTHRRDVLVLITDGEEMGLLGARAFFRGDPMASRAGLVINLEARGSSGRAVMFETHRGAGPLVAALARDGALQGASSLMPDLYRRLPNDTDLSEVLRAGGMGLNFAFFGGQAHYHQPTDTPANLDPGSVQHIGDQALAAARALVDAPALPPRGEDAVYADILGGPVLRYPAWGGWLVLAASVLLMGAAARRARPGALAMARGAAGFVLVVALPALLLFGIAQASAGQAHAWRRALEAYPLALSAYALVALGGALLPIAAVQRLRFRPASPMAWHLGALLAGLVPAFALQVFAPLDAFMVGWPLLCGSAAAALLATGRPAARLLAVVVVALALAQVFYWAGLMFCLVGVGLPVILAGFALLAGLLLTPFAVPAVSGRLAAFACFDLAVLGAGLLAWIVWR